MWSDVTIADDVIITQRTDPSQGAMTFYGFQLSDNAVVFNASRSYDRRIEFIGNSLFSATNNAVEGTSLLLANISEEKVIMT